MLKKKVDFVSKLVVPQNVLVSAFHKNGLEILIPALIKFNSAVMFYSSTATGAKIKEILGKKAQSNYMSIEEFTGSPEMEGGVLKTPHPKVYAGLSSERGNPAHEEVLFKEMAKFGKGPGVFFDIFVGNLYPFDEAIEEEDATPETARKKIDNRRVCLTAAAAQNWHSVAVLSDPGQYSGFVHSLNQNDGITPKKRFYLAQQALLMLGDYGQSIGEYFSSLSFTRDVLPTIKI